VLNSEGGQEEAVHARLRRWSAGAIELGRHPETADKRDGVEKRGEKDQYDAAP
jgi:hypothetical protein